MSRGSQAGQGLQHSGSCRGIPDILHEKGDEQLSIQDASRDEFGHVRLGGIGFKLARMIEQRTGFETRVSVLGYMQRGGSPSSFDRVLASRFGVGAVQLVAEGKFGKMVSLRGNQVIAVDLEDAVSGLKRVDRHPYEIAAVFFG